MASNEATVPPPAVRPLMPGVRKVHGDVHYGPDSAVVDMASRCRGVISALEEPSKADAVAQTANPGLRFLHLSTRDAADQPLRDAIAATVDFTMALVEEDVASDDEANAAAAGSDDDSGHDDPPPLGNAPEAAAPKVPKDADADVVPPPPPRRRGVFIHCHAGQSRSAALAAGYLMAGRQMSLREAVDLLGGPEAVAFNPSFLGQLMALDGEHSESGTSDFDAEAFFIANLQKLFPQASEADARKALHAASGDVYVARNALMRAHAAAFIDRDKIMVDCLCDAVKTQCIPRRIVKEIYEEEGCHRDRALARLINISPEDLVDMMTADDMMSGA